MHALHQSSAKYSGHLVQSHARHDSSHIRMVMAAGRHVRAPAMEYMACVCGDSSRFAAAATALEVTPIIRALCACTPDASIALGAKQSAPTELHLALTPARTLEKQTAADCFQHKLCVAASATALTLRTTCEHTIASPHDQMTRCSRDKLHTRMRKAPRGQCVFRW